MIKYDLFCDENSAIDRENVRDLKLRNKQKHQDGETIKYELLKRTYISILFF